MAHIITNIMVHIPCIVIVYGTSNGPLKNIGIYLGPCSKPAELKRESRLKGGLKVEGWFRIPYTLRPASKVYNP